MLFKQLTSNNAGQGHAANAAADEDQGHYAQVQGPRGYQNNAGRGCRRRRRR